MSGSAENRITIAGCGPGGAGYITPAVHAVVDDAEVLCGADRLLGLFSGFSGVKLRLTADVQGFVEKVYDYFSLGKNVVVLVTGDPGLCSVAQPIIKRAGVANCRIIPGVSALQSAFAALGLDWTSVRIVNAHAGKAPGSFESLADEETIAVFAGNKNAWTWVKGLAGRLVGTHDIYMCREMTLPGEQVAGITPDDLEFVEDGGGTSIFIWTRKIQDKPGGAAMVYFVGAGPGDPDLLTRKAERLLKNCRCCIWAGSLVNPQILLFLPEGAECYDSAGMNLEEIICVMERNVKAGINVVRLHTGEPALFGAIGEQMARLDKLGIKYELVPGISSFQAAAAALKCELTSPEISQAVVLTRSAGRTPVPDAHSLDKLAGLGATICIFLSTDMIQALVQTLLPFYGTDCPAAVVYHASWPDEKVIRGTLENIQGLVQQAGITRTGMIIVGRALDGVQKESRLYAVDFQHGYRKSGEQVDGQGD